MFKFVCFLAVMAAAAEGVINGVTVVRDGPAVALPAPIVTARSSQTIARNYNTFAAAPLAYSAPAVAAPLAYSAPAVAAPLAYSAPAVAAPLAYSAPAVAAPLAYSAPAVAAPLAYSAPAVAAPFAYGAHAVAPAYTQYAASPVLLK